MLGRTGSVYLSFHPFGGSLPAAANLARCPPPPTSSAIRSEYVRAFCCARSSTSGCSLRHCPVSLPSTAAFSAPQRGSASFAHARSSAATPASRSENNSSTFAVVPFPVPRSEPTGNLFLKPLRWNPNSRALPDMFLWACRRNACCATKSAPIQSGRTPFRGRSTSEIPWDPYPTGASSADNSQLSVLHAGSDLGYEHIPLTELCVALLHFS